MSQSTLAQNEAATSRLQIECRGDLSGNASETVCLDIVITDGTFTITAGEARSEEYGSDDGLWRLIDNIEINSSTTAMAINADGADFLFENGELVFAEFRGEPVLMTDYVAEQETAVSATAENMSFDNRDGTLQLLGESTLVFGANEFRGCDLIYNLNDQSYRGSTENCASIQITVAPTEESETRDDESAAP